MTENWPTPYRHSKGLSLLSRAWVWLDWTGLTLSSTREGIVVAGIVVVIVVSGESVTGLTD